MKSATQDIRIVEDAKSLNAQLVQTLEEIASVAKDQESLSTAKLKLEAERAVLILPARSKKDPQARKSLQSIEEKLSAIETDLSYDVAALVSLKERRISLEKRIACAEWEEKRGSLRSALEARIQNDPEARIEKAARELAAAMESAAEQDAELSTALRQFDNHLRGEANAIASARDLRSRFVGLRLEKVLNRVIDTRSVMAQFLVDRTAEEINERVYRNALDALNDLELVF